MSVARWSWLPLGIAGSVVAGPQEIRATVTPSSPPVVQMQAYDHAGADGEVPTAPQPTMTIWRAGEAMCGGQPVASVRAAKPLPALSWGGVQKTPVRVAFRIDASGRPLGIRRGVRRYGAIADVLPALAAAKFTAGAVQSDCVIAFTPDQLPLDQVPADMAMAYTVFPTGPRAPEALWRRIHPADATCFQSAPALLNRAYPDFSMVKG